MSTRTNNTQKTRVSKTNITKLPNRSKLKTPTNEGARKIAYHEEAIMGGYKEICTPVRLLLPASAAAFAPRTSIYIVLGSKVKSWLTSTLKRATKLRHGSSVQQHQSCLTKTLSSSTAIWTLASITLHRAPDTELKDSIPLTQAFQLIRIEAYIIFIDMVSRNEIAFKLTSDSIESLIKYHRGIHCVNLANTHTHSELEVEKLQEEFVQAIHKFVYRTHVSALEGLEPDGSGELLCEKSGEVKTNILSLLLQAPPQKILPPRQKPPLLQKLRPRLSTHPIPQELVLGSWVGALPVDWLFLG